MNHTETHTRLTVTHRVCVRTHSHRRAYYTAKQTLTISAEYDCTHHERTDITAAIKHCIHGISAESISEACHAAPGMSHLGHHT